jgi:hypothetical protein
MLVHLASDICFRLFIFPLCGWKCEKLNVSQLHVGVICSFLFVSKTSKMKKTETEGSDRNIIIFCALYMSDVY